MARKIKTYTELDKHEAASVYVITGNSIKVEDQTGIPSATIRTWMQKPWWNQLVARIRTEKDEQLEAIHTEIIEKAGQQLSDRVQNGDFVLNKQGELTRKPVSARDLAMVSGIVYDKRQLQRNKPTTITTETTEEKLNRLADLIRAYESGDIELSNGKLWESTSHPVSDETQQ